MLRTTWIPSATVAKTETAEVPDAELSMDALGSLQDGDAAREAMQPLVDHYRLWITAQHSGLEALHGEHRSTAEELLRRAGIAAARIESGIAVLADDAEALDAFRVANRAVARALHQRPEVVIPDDGPSWRAFQLAFILLNIPGLVDPSDPWRENVDLLFFPTGGGKTEAYLGLAAFAMVLRRLRSPDQEKLQGAGVAVIMRYTLRPADARPAVTRGWAGVRARARTRRGSPPLWDLAIRDRLVGRPGRNPKRDGPQGRQTPRHGPLADTRVQGEPQQTLAGSLWSRAPGARSASSRCRSRWFLTTTGPTSCESCAPTSNATSAATGRCRSSRSTSRSIGVCRLS